MLISWNVTKACNLKCLHCYRDAGIIDKNELDTSESIELIKEISSSGFKIIIFSGGEPLLRKDIYHLISTSSELGIRAVLGTNGTLLDETTAYRLKKSGLSRVGISIDSIFPSIHDDFRQEKGAWKLSVNAMKACKEAGLEFQVHTTVTNFNYKDVEKITDFASEHGAKAHHIFFLVPTGRGKEIESSVLKQDDYNFLIIKILEKQKSTNIELKPVCAPQFLPLALEKEIKYRFTRGCLAGISYCCILPNGDIHPCPYMPVKTGNVRETPFRKIWAESRLFEELRSLKYNGHCGKCHYKKLCGGCRARALIFSGGEMGEDPYCTILN